MIPTLLFMVVAMPDVPMLGQASSEPPLLWGVDPALGTELGVEPGVDEPVDIDADDSVDSIDDVRMELGELTDAMLELLDGELMFSKFSSVPESGLQDLRAGLKGGLGVRRSIAVEDNTRDPPSPSGGTSSLSLCILLHCGLAL